MSEDNRRLAGRDYVPMTKEELEAWYKESQANLRPLRPGHWTHKEKRHLRLLFNALCHRREHYLYKRLWEGTLLEIKVLQEELEKLHRTP